VLFVTGLAFVATRDYTTNHSVRDAMSFNFSDCMFEFQLFGEQRNVDTKEESLEKIEKLIDEAPFIEHFPYLEYSYDYTYDIKDAPNCDYDNIIYPGMRVTLPSLTWDKNYKEEEKQEEDSFLIDDMYETLDACLADYNYVEDEEDYILHFGNPKIISKFDEDEELINEIEDLLISTQEAVVDNIGEKMYAEAFYDDFYFTEDLENDKVMSEEVSTVLALMAEEESEDVTFSDEDVVSDAILDGDDDILLGFEDDLCIDDQLTEIFPDLTELDTENDFNNNNTYVSIDLQQHIIENRPYMTLEDYIDEYASYLPQWEMEEVMSYDKIYYPGSIEVLHGHTEDFEKSTDHGNGTYKFIPGDQIDYRYEVLGTLGEGGFGIVAEVIDHAVPEDNEHRRVALKVFHEECKEDIFLIETYFAELVQNKSSNPDRFAKTLRTFDFRGRRCCTEEILGEAIREQGGEHKEYEMHTIRKYAYDILMGLKLLREIGVVHGDLKPHNCLFKLGSNESSDIHIVLADFSCSCEMRPPGISPVPCQLILGQYFQPRYYRAPEILMGTEFDTQVDMWSFGIIITELFKGIVPFYGIDEVQMLGVLIQTFGNFPPEMLLTTPKMDYYTSAFDSLRIPVVPKQFPLSTRLFDVPPLLYDLITKVLVINPKERYTPDQALQHPFFEEL